MIIIKGEAALHHYISTGGVVQWSSLHTQESSVARASKTSVTDFVYHHTFTSKHTKTQTAPRPVSPMPIPRWWTGIHQLVGPREREQKCCALIAPSGNWLLNNYCRKWRSSQMAMEEGRGRESNKARERWRRCFHSYLIGHVPAAHSQSHWIKHIRPFSAILAHHFKSCSYSPQTR